jgi:hypothetical protein
MLQHQAGVGNLTAHPQLMKFALELQGLEVGDSVSTEAQPGNHQVTIHLSTLCRPAGGRAPAAPGPGWCPVGGRRAGGKRQIGGKSA